jgi:hypothetical protein
MRILLVSAITLALAACQTLTDIVNALPPETPQEQCSDAGGQWHFDRRMRHQYAAPPAQFTI